MATYQDHTGYNNQNPSGYGPATTYGQQAYNTSPTDWRSASHPSSSEDREKPATRYPDATQQGPLPVYNHNGNAVTKRISPDGESGRRGFNPLHFLKITWKSSCMVSSWLNILWPFVPAAIVLHFLHGNYKVYTFAISYVAMVPSANLLGFAGQELARKLPKVAGILVETTLGSVVEIVLFVILIVKSSTAPGGHNFLPVIQAAILGSILTNLLLCLGMCFLVGGMKHKEQTFHPVISEVGSGILLVAGFGLMIPSAFFSALSSSTSPDGTLTEDGHAAFTDSKLEGDILDISRGTAIILIVAFAVYILYNAVSHDNIFNEVLEGDEERDRDRHRDLNKAKYTLTEALVAIVISIALICLIAVFLVEQIPYIVERGVPDQFLGLILLPLVEKVAEHLTAIDEAYDDQINFALYHCLGPSVQTALFNGPLVVIVSWGLHKSLDLNFEIFMVVLLVLSILVVGNFLRDGSSNYLEGSLLVIVYVIIAMTAWYYPNPELITTNGANNVHTNGGASEESAEHMIKLAKMLMARAHQEI